jgi:DNA-directed RNA polymerase subunit omega
MIFGDVSLADLLKIVPNRYRLVQAVAKRARQLNEGATPLVECGTENPLTIAMHEIAEGKILVDAAGEPHEEGEAEE